MGLLTPFSVPRGGFLYTVIVLGGEFVLPSSRVPGVCSRGMVMDEIDTCIISNGSWKNWNDEIWSMSSNASDFVLS